LTWSSVSDALSKSAVLERRHLFPCHFLIAGKEPGVFDIVIINDDLEAAYEKLKSVLVEVKLFHLSKKILLTMICIIFNI